MYRLFIFYVSIAIILLSCGIKTKSDLGTNKSNSKMLNTSASAHQFQLMIDELITTQGEDPIHNVVLLIESPSLKWIGASGMADGDQEIMTADHKFKIASISKTFTATIILQLIEEGRIKLNDTLEEYLDATAVNLDSLLIFKGVSFGRKANVEQLLSHTSGIRDYMEDDRFIPDVIGNPDKQWSPAKIMEKYYEYNMNHKSYWLPGIDFDYSDVNYVLLAMIIEKVTGSSLQQEYKQRIFNPLNMHNSYLEYYEEPRGLNPFSHAYFSTIDINLNVNTSFDWGGGGIVSTCEELNIFFKALLRGQLFKKKSTLKLMLAEADKGRGGTDYDYGFGIQKRQIHGLTFYGHGGAYDCDAFYCPEKDLSVVMSLNQMNTHGKRDELLFNAIELAI